MVLIGLFLNFVLGGDFAHAACSNHQIEVKGRCYSKPTCPQKGFTHYRVDLIGSNWKSYGSEYDYCCDDSRRQFVSWPKLVRHCKQPRCPQGKIIRLRSGSDYCDINRFPKGILPRDS